MLKNNLIINQFVILMIILFNLSNNICYVQTVNTTQKDGYNGICGTDNRVPSYAKAVGRLHGTSIGTAWILCNGKLVTAGHLLGTLPAKVQFNVPRSEANGTPRNSNDSDIYWVDLSSVVKGDDWAVFEVFPNSLTGLKPKEKQSSCYNVTQDIIGNTVYTVGYGIDNDSNNIAQQSSEGSFLGLLGYEIMHQADIAEGSSGGPIFIGYANKGGGHVVGVHTHDGCNLVDYGFNTGTSTLNPAFWAALNDSVIPPDSIITYLIIDQKLSDGLTSVDSVGIWEGGTSFALYGVPSTFPTIAGSQEILRGSPKIIFNEKYYKWNCDDTVLNHRKFIMQNETNEIISEFNPTHPTITLRNELLDAPTQNFGSIQFKDPWLVDVSDSLFYDHPYGYRNLGMDAPFKSETSPFRPTLQSKYKGVFLNQGNPPYWDQPYYSVRVPQTQRIGAYNSKFAYWTSSKGSEFQIPNALETGVVFKHANDTIKAVYKGHRISSTNAALHSNNQRKLVYVKPSPNSNYNLFLAYESGGKLWLTSSTNNGQDWQLENYIGNGNYISIGQMEPEFGNLILTWQENKSNKKYVYASTGTPNTSILDSNISVSIDPKPVIGILTKNLNKIPPDTINQTAICVVWKGDNSLRYSYFAGLLPKSGPLSWSPASNIYNTNSTHKNPSIAYVKIDSVNYRFYLTYDDGYKIYLRTAVFSGSDINWSHAVVVDSFASNAQIYAERISNNLSIVHFVYERVNQYGRFIRYRKFTDNGWLSGTFTIVNEWGGTNYINPTIAMYYNRTIAISWQDNEKVYLVNYYQNTNSWSNVDHFYGAYSPNLAYGAGDMPIENAKFVYAYGTNQPIRISFGAAKASMPGGGGGGCPFVYVYNGSEYIEDNNILPQSEYTPKENGFVNDYYQLFKKPVETNNTYKLRVAEFEEEISQLDKLSLIIVDHEPEASIGVSETGEISQYAKPVSLSNAQLDEDDVFKFVYELDENYIEAQRGSTLNLIFDRTQAKGFEDNKATEEALALVGIIEPPGEKDKIAGIFGQKTDGKLVNDNQFRLRRNPSFIWIPVESGGSKDGTTEVSISWQQNVKVDYTELSHQLDLPYSVYECELISAEHSTTGDVSEQLREIDNEIVELSPGEWVDLVFDAPELAEGKKRSFIFVSNGRYEKIEKMKEGLALKKQKSKENTDRVIPKEYSLSQNRPNPFNPITQIGYALPAAGHTTLKIYDVLGREVAVLVNELKDAGVYEVVWDATNQPSGVYFYKLVVSSTEPLQSGNFIAVKKMLLLR